MSDGDDQVGRPRNERGDSEGDGERGLDEDRQSQVTACTLEREAVCDVPRCHAHRNAGEREQSGERECVVSDTPVWRAVCCRDEKDRGAGRSRDHDRRDAIDHRGPLDGDAGLAP